MFRNYIKIAIRNLRRQKTYSFINIAGLAIGLAGFILISLYIHDELSYDCYHKNYKKIYRVVNVYDDGSGVGERSSSSPFQVAKTLVDEYPDIIEDATRFFNYQMPQILIEYNDKKYYEKKVFFTDSSAFKIFDFTFIKGNSSTAFNIPNPVIITESIAKKYFEDQDPIGKSIKIDGHINLHVTGVIKDIPSQSHFKIDILGSMTTVESYFNEAVLESWVWNPCWTYVLLKDGIPDEILNNKFPEFVKNYFYDAHKEHVSLYLQPLKDIHLNSQLDYEIEANSKKSYVYILSAIALFILIIAIINFINLSTAFSATRAKEIGVKKILGVNRWQLILQFTSEAIILSFLALIISLALVELTLPYLNIFVEKSIDNKILFAPIVLLCLLLLGIFTGILSGVYPAIYLTAYQPIKVLKGNLKTGFSNGIGRKVLVTTQFAISIGLIITTIVAFKQLEYLRNKDLGFDKEQVIILSIYGTQLSSRYLPFKREILKNPNIINVTGMDYIIGTDHNTHDFKPEGISEEKSSFYPSLIIRHDFLETFNIKVLEGRGYSKNNKMDGYNSILINEAMAKHLGWTLKEAIGKKFYSRFAEEKVIGVVQNFNTNSLHTPVKPFVLELKEFPNEIIVYTKYVAIRVAKDNLKSTLKFIQEKFNHFDPIRPFEYTFLNDELDKLYKDENKLSRISGILSILVIIIAAMGLFGLTSYLSLQRTREFGIRKVLGASNSNIIKLLSKEFVTLIILANIIVWPIAFYGIQQWLNNFAYHLQINIWVFIFSGLIALLMALTITTLRALVIERTNTVEAIKYE